MQRVVYEKLIDMLRDRVSKIHVGRGINEDTSTGPVTIPVGLEKSESQIEDAKKYDATVVIGGSRIDRNGGYFFQPTIIRDASSKMKVAHEETFGQFLALFPFDTEDEVAEAANDTSVCCLP